MYQCLYDAELTCALNKELLSVAAQQGPREKRGKVHKDLPQQRSRFLQSMFQTLRDTKNERKHREHVVMSRIEAGVLLLAKTCSESIRKRSVFNVKANKVDQEKAAISKYS